MLLTFRCKKSTDWVMLCQIIILQTALTTQIDCTITGIREVICRALDIVNPLNKNKLHVSFDVDSIDESLIPSTGTTVVGGLSVREAITIGQTISSTGQMIALDVVELNPNIGTPQQAHQSAKNTIDIVLSFFGKSSLGYYHKNAE